MTVLPKSEGSQSGSVSQSRAALPIICFVEENQVKNRGPFYFLNCYSSLNP